MGEKIISREIIGSSNPFARFFRGLGNSIKGILSGIFMIIFSFVLVGFAANQMEHSKAIEELPLMSPEEAASVEGMVKVSGEPTYSNIVEAPMANDDVLYYNYVEEEYAIREIQKTRTVTEDGQDYEETYVEYKPEWETVKTESGWSDFSMGNIEINPENAKNRLVTNKLFNETYELDYPTYKAENQLVDIPQRKRVTVTGVKKDTPLIVVGYNSNGRIASGEDNTFFITNKSNQQLVQDEANRESTSRWGLLIFGWLLMTLGFTALFGPITFLLNVIPGLGSLTKGLLFLVFGVLSAILVFLAYLGIKYWWVFGIAILAIGGLFVYKAVTKKSDNQATPAEPQISS